MSALETEIASLVQDKYLMTSLGVSVSQWSAEALARAYQRLLSVYDSCFDFPSSTSCVKAKLQHVQKCLRLLGIGHLAPKLDELTDTGRALRIISALDDKISAKHSVQIAAKRNRVIIKQEELRNKPAKKVVKVPVRKENFEQENVDPNIISTNPEEPVGKVSISTSSSGVIMTQNEWLVQQKADSQPTEAPKEEKIATIIPTGRQLPRTPVKPSDLPPEDTDSPETSCAIENNDQDSPFLSVAPAGNHIPSGRQLPRTPKAEEDFNSSDDQSEFRNSESLLEEKSHHSITLATQKKSETNRRGTFVLPTPPRCQQTVLLSEDSLIDSERRGTFTFPPHSGYENKDSYSEVSEGTGDRRGTFTFPSPLENERDDDTMLDRRGTYTFPPPAEFKGEDSYGEEVDSEENRSTFTLPPPVGYEGEESHSNVTEGDAARRGTFTLPPPSGCGEYDTYSAANAPNRRGTYNVSSTEMDGESLDSSQDEDDNIFLSETNRRETFAIPLHSEKEERRGTYAISGPSDDDRRGTYAISGPTDVRDRRGTYAISGPSDVGDRRGTYAVSGPPDENDRRGTFAISGPSGASDRRGTYDLGKGPCTSEDYVGPICSNKMKKEILVFGQDSLNTKPMGPIPDLSEFDDLPFTDELPTPEVTVSDRTFQSDSVESSREVSELSEKYMETPFKSNEVKNASHEDIPLPVTSVMVDNCVTLQPPTAKENYIPRGKQIPRTPNENDSKEKSNSLVNSTGTETTFEHSSIGGDPNFSVQIFVATPKRPQNANLTGAKEGDVALIEIPKDDSDLPRNKIQNNYDTTADTKITPQVKQNSKQLQPKLMEESPRTDWDSNPSEKYSVTSSVDLQDRILEDKSPNHLADSSLWKKTNISDFDDSLEIFPSKTRKITMKNENSITGDLGGASRVAEGELTKDNTSIVDIKRTKMGDTENKNESHGSSEEEMQNKYALHKNEFRETLKEDIMHNPEGKRKQVRGNRKEKTTEMLENLDVLAHTQKKDKVKARVMKLEKNEPEVESNSDKLGNIKEEENNMLPEREVNLKHKSTKSKQEKRQRSARSCKENKPHDADLNSSNDTVHNDSNQLFLHPVKANRQGQKESQDDSQKKAEDTKSVKEEPVEPKEKKSRQRKAAEDKTVKRRGRRKENAISEDCGNIVETAITKSEKGEKQDSVVEPSIEKDTNSKSDELSPVKPLPRRGRRKKIEPVEILQITEDEVNVKTTKLSSSEALPEVPAKQMRGRLSRRAPKDPPPKENNVELNETIPVQKGKKKSDVEEKMTIKKKSASVCNTSEDKKAADKLTEPVLQEVVKETLQPEPKSRTKRQTRKKNDETVIKSPTTSIPAKKSTKQKKTQEENADLTVVKDSTEENLMAETKKSTRRKKIQMENVVVVEEKVETLEKAKTARARNDRGSKKTLDPEGELVSENIQTNKPKGRRKKASPSDSLIDVEEQNQEAKEKEVQKQSLKAPRGSRKKKNAEISPDVSSQEVLPAAGRPGRRCKAKASAAIAETLNSSDSEFLNTIRAYKS
ncbi:protein ELYS-like [Penaeus chinensis]|uniref:protein ELYS-like n=1 Tax=Penaeus chinensis TaxID=139456 RepID=UPI001FB70518|nr:protein ELYS-like [Penaeus chinensis]